MIRTILFTGHMIDKPGRKKPRFPPGKEEAVKQEIQRVIAQEIKTQSNIKGIAGGACGGDIIFHEVCLEMGVLSEMFLTLPVDEYKKTSVSFAGPAWDARFDLLQSRIPVHVMSQFKKNKKEDNIWEQTNVWMLDEALNNGIQNMVLIALQMDGNNKAGGTKHMVDAAKAKGACIIICKIN